VRTPTAPARPHALAAGVLAGALLLTGCTSTVDGTASPVAAGTSQAPESSSEAPETSEAPTGQVTPAPEIGPGTGAEARRIASVSSLISTTSPERTEGCFPSGPFGSASGIDVLYFGDGRVEQELDRWGFVAGWGNCNQDVANNGSLTLAAEMSDPDSAVAAAEALNEIGLDYDLGGTEPVELPDLGVTGALTAGGADSAGNPTDTAQAWVPTGRMLAYAFVDAPAGGAVDLLTRQLQDQLALLATFEPTPQDQVPDLDSDPLDLARYALAPPGDPTRFTGGYDLEGYLRFAIDPIAERTLLSSNGFTGFYAKQSGDDATDLEYAVALYAFPTSAQTNAVYEGFRTLETTEFGGTPFVLPAIPDAPCFVFASDDTGTSFYQRCYVGFGSYLASLDVLGVTAIDDYSQMNTLLPQQRDLIDG